MKQLDNFTCDTIFSASIPILEKLNYKSQIANNKRFDKLTALSQVEG